MQWKAVGWQTFCLVWPGCLQQTQRHVVVSPKGVCAQYIVEQYKVLILQKRSLDFFPQKKEGKRARLYEKKGLREIRFSFTLSSRAALNRGTLLHLTCQSECVQEVKQYHVFYFIFPKFWTHLISTLNTTGFLFGRRLEIYHVRTSEETVLQSRI